MKWGLVIAGLGDLSRPAENLSILQTLSLTATGVIWSRYSTQIIPVNYNLMAVNLFVGAIGLIQCSRIFMYRQTDEYKQKQLLQKST
ncbi:Mitochondrial pyruvate carrier 2 [Clydaea vesicula]|uniref:Mitochondrial pyruvate carrier n=1 Tax=Clydaea vesicula TaxID=447962 RepID=A0AAD5U3E5_9FUNG|nr:Mitochondrial pyruvate carrier 2 [Clydaea vesicula]